METGLKREDFNDDSMVEDIEEDLGYDEDFEDSSNDEKGENWIDYENMTAVYDADEMSEIKEHFQKLLDSGKLSEIDNITFKKYIHEEEMRSILIAV